MCHFLSLVYLKKAIAAVPGKDISQHGTRNTETLRNTITTTVLYTAAKSLFYTSKDFQAQWRTERGGVWGVQTPPPPEILKISVESSIT